MDIDHRGGGMMITDVMRAAFDRDGFVLVPDGDICQTRKPDHVGTVS